MCLHVVIAVTCQWRCCAELECVVQISAAWCPPDRSQVSWVTMMLVQKSKTQFSPCPCTNSHLLSLRGTFRSARWVSHDWVLEHSSNVVSTYPFDSTSAKILSISHSVVCQLTGDQTLTTGSTLLCLLERSSPYTLSPPHILTTMHLRLFFYRLLSRSASAYLIHLRWLTYLRLLYLLNNSVCLLSYMYLCIQFFKQL
jgi:hypothetical protein